MSQPPFRLSTRAKGIIGREFDGSFDAVIERIKNPDVVHRPTGTRVYSGLQHLRRLPGMGKKTMQEIAVAALVSGGVDFEEIFPNHPLSDDGFERRERAEFNSFLRRHGWQGPFLQEVSWNVLNKRGDPLARLRKLKNRRQRLALQIEEIDQQIVALN